MSLNKQLTLENKVEQILLEAAPMIAMHGGEILLADIDDNQVVHLDFRGACSDCVIADITLNDGLKEAIMLACPEVTDVVSNIDAENK